MIGAESIASSPTSTGHVPTFSQPAASVADTNRPPRSSVCVEQNACRSASSRSSPTHGVVLRIVTVSRAPVDLDVDESGERPERERPGPDGALDALLQEADGDLDVVRVALQQHLRAHQARVVRMQRGPGGREDAAERPAALVLQRRSAGTATACSPRT